MVVNPVSGKVYVSNLEALNHVRFEGAGVFAATAHRRAGTSRTLAESRIT